MRGARVVSRPNSLPLPFRTPATQARWELWVILTVKSSQHGGPLLYLAYYPRATILLVSLIIQTK